MSGDEYIENMVKYNDEMNEVMNLLLMKILEKIG